jgi:flagellar motor protein MotB
MMSVGAAYRIAADQSAGHASGHVAAAPLSSMMNWRLSSARAISVGRAHLDAERLGGLEIDDQLELWSAPAPSDRPGRLLNAFALD